MCVCVCVCVFLPDKEFFDTILVNYATNSCVCQCMFVITLVGIRSN